MTPVMLNQPYGHKIKTIEELLGILGAPPRGCRVVMCHGVFDLVHPGHLRHMLYAKSKADVLVVSITADVHIDKAAYRPFVPENLRALNLAALEMVDYVTISRDAKPLDSLARLCPDYYAKGYEYSDGGIHPKTREEMDVLASYGGEMLFTPGDIVFSSSHIIENVPPNIAIDKLLTLMQAEGVDFSDLRRSVEEMRGVSVHVLGDTIIDSLTYTTMIGGMTKTPTPSVRHDRREDFIGGAAIVAQHLRAAGAEVTFSTVLGDDAFKDPVLSSLAADGIVIKAVIDASRPTTHKNAFVCGGYRLLKVDTLDNRSISDAILDRLMGQLAETSAQAVVFSDFRHGIFNRRTIPGLIKAIPDGAFRVGDSQVASRWGNVLDFKGFDMLTPNEREARFALADQDTGIRPLSVRLRREAECGTVILKLGDRGILTCRDADPTAFRSFFTVDSFADHVADAVGAGDALLAYATLAMVATGSEVIASILGSLAAALECERDGNIPIRGADMLGKIDAVERAADYGR